MESADTGVAPLEQLQSSLALLTLRPQLLILPPPISAAQKVFNLPELLGPILHHVSSSSADPRRPQVTQPARQLFVLQRVNTTFRNVIRREEILQRRMHLAPYPTGSRCFHNPVLWLKKNVGFSDYSLSGNAKDRSLVLVPVLDWYEPQARWENPAASWRSMRPHVGGDFEVLRIKFDEGGVGVRLRFHWTDGSTLGAMHDGLQRFFPKIAELEQAYKAYKAVPRFKTGRNAALKLLIDLGRDFKKQCEQDVGPWQCVGVPFDGRMK